MNHLPPFMHCMGFTCVERVITSACRLLVITFPHGEKRFEIVNPGRIPCHLRTSGLARILINNYHYSPVTKSGAELTIARGIHPSADLIPGLPDGLFVTEDTRDTSQATRVSRQWYLP